MDKYLEQIHELETASRSASSSAKMAEKYKDKSVVLERERFEAMAGMNAVVYRDEQQTVYVMYL